MLFFSRIVFLLNLFQFDVLIYLFVNVMMCAELSFNVL